HRARNARAAAGPGAGMTLDLRLVPAALGAWVAAFGGVLLPPALAAGGAGVLLALALWAAWSLWRRPGTRPSRRGRHRDLTGPTPQATVALALVVAALVLLSAAAQVHQRAAGLLGDLVATGAVAPVSGRATGGAGLSPAAPERGGRDRVRVRQRAEVVEGRGLPARVRAPALVLARPTWQDVQLGARVALPGRVV